MPRLKIIFVLPSLRAGGAERVLTFLATALNHSQFDTRLVVLGFKEDASYEYPEHRTIFLNKHRTRSALRQLYIVLTRERPDIAMSSIGQLNTLLGLYSLILRKIRFVGRIATVSSEMSKFSNFKSGWFSGFLFNYGHKRLKLIICQSRDMLIDLEKNYGLSRASMTIINNPVTAIPERVRKNTEEPETVKFITIGRLSKVKGHERLLESLSRINSFPYHYTIIGSGPENEAIRAKAAELKLTDKITYIPFSDNVYDELFNHHIFLQGSYSEGFPNAVLESGTVGLPVLGYNVPGGTKEIIKEGINGFLANNTEEFDAHLRQIKQLLALDPKKISKYTLEKFSSDKILKQYEQVFAELVSR